MVDLGDGGRSRKKCRLSLRRQARDTRRKQKASDYPVFRYPEGQGSHSEGRRKDIASRGEKKKERKKSR